MKMFCYLCTPKEKMKHMINNSHTETWQLTDGMRIVCRTQADMPVVYLGIAVGVGARHETDGEQGMAHFCEHMAFKGTTRRSALQIINRLEGVGGELNAFTTKEDTVLHAACERQHLQRALELLCDIAFHSRYPEQEMEREVEVICDEIDSYRDTPSELIYDDFENLLFPGHPLGHDILGDAEQLRGYTQPQLAAFARRHYRPANAVLFVWGNVQVKELLRLLGQKSTKGAKMAHDATHPGPRASVAGDRRPESAASAETATARAVTATAGAVTATAGAQPVCGMTERAMGTHQAHVIVGCQACCAQSADRPALYLLNNMLGGPSLNARLNLALRERRGLVYTVESSLVCYSDTGAWTTYLGCDASDLKRCLRLVRQELDRLCQSALSERLIAAARQQLHGQLALASQNIEQRAIDMGRTMLHTGAPRSLQQFLAEIDALTPPQLLSAAQRYLAPQRLLTLVYRS